MVMRFRSLVRNGSELKIHLDQDEEDGSTSGVHWSLPDNAFMIRAAEYGMDPVADEDAIWDMLMYEPYVDETDSFYPPLVTAPTLEDARDQHLARCLAAKERIEAQGGLAARGVDEVHEEVKAALRAEVPVDMQLITLIREETKLAVKKEQMMIKQKEEETRTPVQVEKSRLIDAIREREGV